MQQTSVQNNENMNKRMKFIGGNGMFKQMKKRVNNQKGLTLIELLAVVVILGIIAAIAVPAIGGIIDNSRAKALVADATNVMNAANLYFVDNPDATNVTLTKLKDEGFIESAGKLKSATVKNETPISISATGTLKSATGGEYTFAEGTTLAELTGATVTKGVIKLGDKETGTGTE